MSTFNLSFLQLLSSLLQPAAKPAAADPVFNLDGWLSLDTPPVTPDAVSAPATPAPAASQAAGRTYFGGMGRDVLSTGAGNDVLDGGMGNDVLDAGAGDNLVQGGMGDDKLTVGHGHNTVDGGMGNDVIQAGHGRNRLYGGMGNDTITAGNGGNEVDAGMGNDTVTAGHGDNRVDAGMGNDSVTTGNGRDILTGGMGNDWLSAGGGQDAYRFDGAFGRDVIDNRDASDSTDRVEFSAGSGIQAQQLWFRRNGADLVVDAVGTGRAASGSQSNGINGLSFGSGDVFSGNVFGQNGGTLTADTKTVQREGSITLRNWYSDPASQVDLFQDASGRTLQKGQVDGLVSAMAGFGGVPANLSSLSESQRQQLDVVIAQSWAA
ncbi:calcium-binding protein [Stenotrophomonas sp. HITSZ_GD]|uniref:calcium-binding protein n=1 Tax=Stenotrophomonas sp. HITSZ_GD TaxID=3037248 RepID=UPI00240CF8D2|nr:calcium-binding protein [Stenotrophomonas sp. HITSZ_GD]MDG2524342.1 calcium-binding protein [Stenotrophomonas sp. HITSZ_GD]